jgi:DNA-directed RNA polymerase specialized sigma24 family protein
LRYWHGWTQKEVAQALGMMERGLQYAGKRALARWAAFLN